MSVTSDLIRIQEMKIYHLLSILIILLAVSSSHQRSIASIASVYTEEAETLATPWSVEAVEDTQVVTRHRPMSVETSEETMAEATPWP